MTTENNNHLQIRITIALILAAVGVAFMSRLPQLLPGQQAIAWYQSGFFWAGIVIVVMALLILVVPPKNWRHIWQSVLGIPAWLRETYIWYRYGPRCILETPVIDFALYPDEHMRKYSAVVFLTVFISKKTLSYCPVRCDFGNAKFQLNQRHKLIPLCAPLELNPLQGRQILLNNTVGKTSHRVSFSWFPYDDPATLFIDTQKNYMWEIEDVRVYLDNLHSYRKLSIKGWVSNAEKTE